ncbi:MAG: heat-inducible transcriptional repressor HrcA [Gemmatimonadota bacterium]|nr:heat-inducible transcriptional repressor HrcA [Gemmatimonadota bacterium]
MSGQSDKADRDRGDSQTAAPYELSERECQVLDAVVRTYVDTAEPAGSRTVSRKFDLGVSAATVRNTMSDLEDMGYLSHPHASAGRVPTDRAYRFFVDEMIRPARLSEAERDSLARELNPLGFSAVERLVRRATGALSVLSTELGLAIMPRMRDAVLEKLDLVTLSTEKVLMVATLQGGIARTVYVDLPGRVPADTLSTVALVLNERLAGLSLDEIRTSLPERLRDASGDDASATELLNIFMQAGAELLDPKSADPNVHLGQTSVLAQQPEFRQGERLKALIELTERRELLASVLGNREHPAGLQVTIGGEHGASALTDFTLVTAEYSVGGLKGVIGVIGPTRMPYEKVIAIVDYTSSLVNRVLGS